mgnify:CR=1 FL=1
MTFLLENIDLNSKSEDFAMFKQKFKFIRSMQAEMEEMWNHLTKRTSRELKNKTKSNDKQHPEVSLDAWVRTVRFYRDTDYDRLKNNGII